jgi:glyoxylase-like metal-dependent hydrolase (beta-lactamase superfamily II)
MMVRNGAGFCAAFAGLLTGCLLMAGGAWAQGGPAREITPLGGELYRFRNMFHYSLFLVTPAGIVATDPIDREAAQWLKQELNKRFTVPVKYLVYSHDHADHISGGEVFADTAVVIAHERAKAAIINKGHATAHPQLVFSDRLTIELAGKLVELSYLGKNHSDNSIVLRFPEQRVLFAVDFIPVKSLPFRTLGDSYVEEWIESLKRVEGLDFEVLVPGHGSVGRKADVRAFRGYMEELWGQVTLYAGQGKSLEEIKGLVKMDKYRQWSQYEAYLPLNIEGMWAQVRRQN